MKEMDEHKKNFVISLAVCCASMLVLLTILSLTWFPYKQEQTEQYLNKYNCNIGQENEGGCTVESYDFVTQALVCVPVLVFIFTMNKLEKKRKKTWRSYR